MCWSVSQTAVDPLEVSSNHIPEIEKAVWWTSPYCWCQGWWRLQGVERPSVYNQESMDTLSGTWCEQGAPNEVARECTWRTVTPAQFTELKLLEALKVDQTSCRMLTGWWPFKHLATFIFHYTCLCVCVFAARVWYLPIRARCVSFNEPLHQKK